MLRRPGDRRGGLDPVSRCDHRNIRQRPDPGEILDRVVGGAKLAIGHPRTDPDKLHVGPGIGNIGLDLLERAPGQERRGSADIRHLSAVRQAGAHADHVLFGDADIDQAIRKPVAEPDKLR
jgi:hypothetical protein